MNEDHKTKKDSLLARRELARRWKVSIETLKRREAKILRLMRLDAAGVSRAQGRQERGRGDQGKS
jgi:hypothetical protein